jgi:hypothetical protein
MPVSEQHADYRASTERWELVRSIIANDAKKLIREVDYQDPLRSEQYRKDAILTNFTRLTREGLKGLVFRRPATINVPPELEYLIDDSTGYNFTIEQFAQQVIGELLDTGKHGILVDYPENPTDDSVARFKPYCAEAIINWRYQEYGSEYKLQMVVLKENITVPGVDKFDWQPAVQYRVLFLDENGFYNQEVYNQDEVISKAAFPVLNYHGAPMDEIPFQFIGSENNDATMDMIPLYDLAIVNLGHYRNSADYEESIFVTGQPMVVVNLGDHNEQEFKQANPGGIRFGSRSGLIVGAGGSATLLQANANQLAQTAMNDKKADAVSIGARLIAPPGGRETAEAARIRFGAQNSALYIITKNASLGLEQCFDWAAEMQMAEPVDSELELNNQFYEEDADPNLIASEMMLFDRGLMTSQEVRMNLDKSGIQLGDVEPDPVDPMIGVDAPVIGTPVKPAAIPDNSPSG